MDNIFEYFKYHTIFYLFSMGVGILLIVTGIRTRGFMPEYGFIIPVIFGSMLVFGGIVGIIFLMIDYFKRTRD